MNLKMVATPIREKNDGHLIEYNGEEHTLKEWSEISGINYSTLKRRINKDNVDIKTALLPSKNYRKRER